MRKLTLQAIELEGIRSFKKRRRIEFSTGHGFGYLTGRNIADPSMGGNATGKSSLLDALCWCFFQKTLRALRAGAIQNWDADKGYNVSVYLLVNEDETVVTRTWKPNSLTINGEEVSQEVAEDLIGLNFDEFVQAICIGQFTTMFLDLAPPERTAIFSKVLPLERWEKYSEISKVEASEVQEEIEDIESRTTTLMAQRSILGIKELRVKSDAWELSSKKENAGRVKKRNKLRREIKSRMLAIKRLKKEHIQLKSKRAGLSKTVETLQEYHSKVLSKKELIEKRISRKEGRIDALKSQLKRISGLKKECPVCGSKLSKAHREKEVSEINYAIESIAETMTPFELDLSDTVFDLTDVSRGVQKASLEETQVSREVSKCKANILSEEYAVKERTDDLEELLEHSGEVNPYTEMLEEARAKKNKIKKTLEVLDLKKKELVDKYNKASFWVKGFKGVQFYIVNSVLAQLEIEVNDVIASLGMEGWRMAFAMDKSNKSGSIKKGFMVNIYSPSNKKPVPWEVWSGGESQRLRVAAQLGLANLILHRKGVSTNVQFFDEPTSHLSKQGVTDVVNTLRDWAYGSGRWVWLVDHRSIDYPFDRVVTVEKTKQGSRIIGGGVFQ